MMMRPLCGRWCTDAKVLHIIGRSDPIGHIGQNRGVFLFICLKRAVSRFTISQSRTFLSIVYTLLLRWDLVASLGKNEHNGPFGHPLGYAQQLGA